EFPSPLRVVPWGHSACPTRFEFPYSQPLQNLQHGLGNHRWPLKQQGRQYVSETGGPSTVPTDKVSTNSSVQQTIPHTLSLSSLQRFIIILYWLPEAIEPDTSS